MFDSVHVLNRYSDSVQAAARLVKCIPKPPTLRARPGSLPVCA